MTILVTGGAGYIGSHTCLVLLEAGFEVLVLDNLHNSNPESLNRVSELTGKPCPLITADVNDQAALDAIFASHQIEAVVHFAGLKAVGESHEQPLAYYRVNLGGTVTLCEVMAKHRCSALVFSSSATVYGDPEQVPIVETCKTQATNPYGRSKLMVEEILRDLQDADNDFWRISLLRYFNPIGAHPSGRIGEDPNGVPNNLLPFVAQVASGRRAQVAVFGDDYDTSDGTGVRDYLHVMDLARGHLRAIEHLLNSPPDLHVFNLGTGQGYSVLEIIAKFQEISDQPIPYTISARRPGDIATCFADPTRANTLLDWRCEHGLEDMIRDAWRWQAQNPTGYSD